MIFFLYSKTIFTDWSIWFVYDYENATVKQKVSKWSSKKKEKGRKNKADEKCKGLLDRFGTSETTEESTASSTQVVNSSYNCLMHNQMSSA